MNIIPNSWTFIPLTSLYYLPTGVKEYSGLKSYFSTGSIKVKIFTSEGNFNYLNRPSRANRMSSIGDIFQARMKATNKALLIDEILSDNLFSTGFFQLRPNSIMLDSRYLWHYFSSSKFLTDKDDNCTGATQQSLNDTNAKKILIPLAPLNEQKRISQKLDELLATVESIKTRLDNAPTIIKRFRQSILSAATSGKLTEEWRGESIDVINTYKSIIEQKKGISFEEYKSNWNNFNIPQNWNSGYLKDIADLRLGKMLDKNKNVGEEVNYLANINVRWFTFNLNDLKELKMTSEERKKLSIKNGDVFICEGGEPGRAAVWEKGTTNITFQKALHRVRFQIPFVSEWLVMNLKVDADSNKLNQLFTGTTIKHFTGRSLAKYPILLPPIEEQKEIVSQVESLFTLADTLEEKIEAAKKRVDKLTQSILVKAFRGELVPQDPNDEPAEKLLERIRAEQANEKPKKARKKK